MLKMERDGLILLPAAKKPAPASKVDIVYTPEAEIQAEICCRAGDLRDLHLEIVESKSDKRLWAELVHRYHYLNYKPLGGAQIRYLIRSEGRVLGCLGFSSAAWKTAPRDEFIGWTHTQRERNLQKVVDNTRYLILPWVKIHSLASRALALAARRLPADWEKRYGYRPVLLETFVEKARFKGTCYKAANWIHVGETKGRGRYDEKHQARQPIKTIWLYPLDRNFSRVLCQ